MPQVHAIVLTFNEEVHLARCLASLRELCATITVVDSGSQDRTLEIARSFGAEVIHNPWINYAKQMNFGVDHVAGLGGWLLRMDADEYLCEGAIKGLHDLLDTLPDGTDGVCLRLRRIFMERWLKHGGLYPIWLLRLWRNGRGRCEDRWMDEYISVEGEVHHAPFDFADHSLKSIAWWSNKHVGYACREAIDVIMHERSAKASVAGSVGRSSVKRLIKVNIYNRLPGGVRSFLYFFYRYFLRLGFLDGRAGYYFHALQGFWYRTLVDAIIFDIKDLESRSKLPLREAIIVRTGIDPGLAFAHVSAAKSAQD